MPRLPFVAAVLVAEALACETDPRGALRTPEGLTAPLASAPEPSAPPRPCDRWAPGGPLHDAFCAQLDRGAEAARSLGVVEAVVVPPEAPDGPGERRIFTISGTPDALVITPRTFGPHPSMDSRYPASTWQVVDGDIFQAGLVRLAGEEGILVLDVLHGSAPRPLPAYAWASWVYAFTWLGSDGLAYDFTPPGGRGHPDPWAEIDRARARGKHASARALLLDLAAHTFWSDPRLAREALAAESAGDLDLALRIAPHVMGGFCDETGEDVYGRISLRAGHAGTYLQVRMRSIGDFFAGFRRCGNAPLRVRTDVGGLQALDVDVDRLLAGLVMEPDTSHVEPPPPEIDMNVLAGLIREMGRSEPVSAELLRRVADPALDEWNRWRALMVRRQLLVRPTPAPGEPFHRFGAYTQGICRRVVGEPPLLLDSSACE